jgi:SAM-dependent methyltransferase
VNAHANPFDRGPAEAAAYDAWYDSSAGDAVLRAEQRCVAELLDGAARPWLDLGTGSGRFGGPLAAEVGLDPALELLRMARERMPSVVRGVAEALPFRDASLGAVVAVAVLEFLEDPAIAMREIARALRPGGRLVLGFFPRDAAWAAAYERQGQESQSVFHGARFFSIDEVKALAGLAGLLATGSRAALFEAPGAAPSDTVTSGAAPSAGFVALSLRKPAAAPGGPQP